MTQLQKHSLTDQSHNIQTQLKIDDMDDQKIALIGQVKALKDEAQSLESYSQYLDHLLTDQNNEKTSLITQIKSVQDTRQGLVPLMVRMLDNLKQFIELDSPFLAQERQTRLTQLKTMMTKADVSEAEKFRRLLASYHIEAEYGSKMGEYQGALNINGVERTVNYFYLGRIVFAAVSLDGKNVWAWNRASNQWVVIDDAYASDIEKAIRIAKKTDIPALLKLPLLSEAK